MFQREKREKREKFVRGPKKCIICKSKVKIEVDYKDVNTLSHFLNRWQKIESGSRSGACTKHQRQITLAVKRARHLALLPFTVR